MLFLSFGTSGGVLSVRYNVKGDDNYERLLKASRDLNRLLEQQAITDRFGGPLKKGAKRSSQETARGWARAANAFQERI